MLREESPTARARELVQPTAVACRLACDDPAAVSARLPRSQLACCIHDGSLCVVQAGRRGTSTSRQLRSTSHQLCSTSRQLCCASHERCK